MTSPKTNHNLFAALRAAFPADLDAIAVETADTDRPTLNYSWRDLERATAMMANLLVSLKLPGWCARGRAGGKIGRGHDAVPGHAARGLRVLAAEHRLPERRD
jgi:hypothetical protein